MRKAFTGLFLFVIFRVSSQPSSLSHLGDTWFASASISHYQWTEPDALANSNY